LKRWTPQQRMLDSYFGTQVICENGYYDVIVGAGCGVLCRELAKIRDCPLIPHKSRICLPVSTGRHPRTRLHMRSR
jgi:hypothetical protein